MVPYSAWVLRFVVPCLGWQGQTFHVQWASYWPNSVKSHLTPVQFRVTGIISTYMRRCLWLASSGALGSCSLVYIFVVRGNSEWTWGHESLVLTSCDRKAFCSATLSQKAQYIYFGSEQTVKLLLREKQTKLRQAAKAGARWTVPMELRKWAQHGGDIFPSGVCTKLRAAWPRGSLSLADLEIEKIHSSQDFSCTINHDLFSSVVQTSRFKGCSSDQHIPLCPYSSVVFQLREPSSQASAK